ECRRVRRDLDTDAGESAVARFIDIVADDVPGSVDEVLRKCAAHDAETDDPDRALPLHCPLRNKIAHLGVLIRMLGSLIPKPDGKLREGHRSANHRLEERIKGWAASAVLNGGRREASAVASRSPE